MPNNRDERYLNRLAREEAAKFGISGIGQWPASAALCIPAA